MYLANDMEGPNGYQLNSLMGCPAKVTTTIEKTIGVREGKISGGGKKFARLFRIVPALSKKFSGETFQIVVDGGGWLRKIPR
jgi:hypothetical protein